MKYIDAGKLIAEIERRIEMINIQCQESRRPQFSLRGKINGLKQTIDLIRILQNEQPKFKIGDTIHEIGENTVFPMTIERISDGDYVCDGGKCFVSIKFQDGYELVQQEQPEVDLEEEIEWEWVHREKQEVDLVECAEMEKSEFVRFARHFYELGCRHAAVLYDDIEFERQRRCEEEKSGIPTIKGWVARDRDGALFLHEKYPKRIKEEMELDGEICYWGNGGIRHYLDRSLYPDLKFTDEPIEVELTITPIKNS